MNDIGEFLLAVLESISEETGEYNTRTAPVSLPEMREWAERLYAEWEAEQERLRKSIHGS